MEFVNLLEPFLTRRTLLRFFCGAGLAQTCRALPESTVPLGWNTGHAASLNLERRYRCDAHVLLLGVPLLHRENVGGGSILWREFTASGAARLLEFNGYSSPERAAGVNRLGCIREMARLGECVYFGLMTSSPEETAEEARNALHSTAKEQAYSAIRGRVGAGETETTTAHFTAPAAISGARISELEDMANRALESASLVAAREPAPEYSQSFLQALAGLLLRPDAEQEPYSYSGRRYRMQISRSEDAKATAVFRERGLIRGPATAIRISGLTRRESGGGETEFHLWISDRAERPLPLRIEYRAKSYLRLIFEAVG
jgi:hypothetical protein